MSLATCNKLGNFQVIALLDVGSICTTFEYNDSDPLGKELI